MLEVLPWSVAMPLVVKRLTCSIERMPSRTACADILGGDVVLEIDERLDRRVGTGAGGSAQHAARPALRGSSPRRCALRRFARRPPSAASRRPPGLGDRRRQPVGAVAGADRDAVLRIVAGQEALGRIVEGDLAARLREQVHRRRPAGRHQDRVDRRSCARRRRSSAATVIDETRSLPPAPITARPAWISMPSAARLVDRRPRRRRRAGRRSPRS